MSSFGIVKIGISFAAGHFATRRRNFAERFAVIRHIGEHDENVHAFFEREVFRRRKRAPRRDDAFDGRSIGERLKHDDFRKDARFFKGVGKKARDIVFDSHAGKDHDELFVARAELCLTDDLRGELIVR